MKEYSIIIGILIIWALAFWYYSVLPNTVPTHFGVNGTPNSYGSKSTVFIIAGVMSVAPIILLLTYKFRWTLIKKYPYLINLPAFVDKKNKKSMKAYFDGLLEISVFLTYYLVLVEFASFYSIVHSTFPAWLTAIIIILPIAIIVWFIWYLKQLAMK